MPADPTSFRVEPSEQGERLDRFLARRLARASRAAVRRLIEQGAVTLNGRRGLKGSTLARDDRIVVSGEAPGSAFSPRPDPDLDVRVLYEDADMVVADKPPLVPCHPLRQGEGPTVAGAMVARYPELETAGPVRREAGLLHRLDTGTSGVLVFARTPAAFAALVEQVRSGQARKVYRALVEGDAMGLESIALPIAPRGKKVRVSPGGRPRRGTRPMDALTRVRPLRRIADLTLIDAVIRSGRRHQIRAHLAAVGHPIAGDRLYGARTAIDLKRPFLHAREIRLVSPTTGRTVLVRSPIASDLVAALRSLARCVR